jgi:hypothetical protein
MVRSRRGRRNPSAQCGARKKIYEKTIAHLVEYKKNKPAVTSNLD